METVSEQILPIEDMIAADENIENYTMTASSGSATISVNLKDKRKMSTQEVVDKWIEDTSDIVDMQLDITMSSSMSMGTSSSSGASITIGSVNLEDAKEASEMIQEATWNIPGVLNVSSDAGNNTTQLRVVVDPLSAMSHGMTPAQVAGGLYSMLSGTTAMTVTSDGEEYDVDLEFPKGTYASQLMDADIGGIPLSELATVEYTNAAQTIMKMDGKYTVTVTASCLSDDKSDIQDTMDQLLTTLDLPDSVSEAKTLMDTMQDDMFGDMGKALATAVFLVFLVMAMQFESPKYSLMVMLSIPFSLIGAFGLMGVLTLVGTVVNNGILYVDGVNMMRRRMDVEDALIEAGKTRLRPILITTLTTVISMTPSALGFGGRSSVMMQGMALVIIGGLVASTILILVLMPVFYLIVYGTSKKNRRKKRQKYYFWKRKTNTEKPLEEV